MSKKRIQIAKITKAHGIKGAVKLRVYIEDKSLFEDCGPLYTGEHSNISHTVKIISKGPKGWLAQIDDIDDRNMAETLHGTELWIDRDKIPETKNDDEFYTEDLIGLTANDENGSIIGAVIDVVNFGAGDLLEIKPEGNHSFYLTFTKENVPDIDLAGSTLTVIIPEEI